MRYAHRIRWFALCLLVGVLSLAPLAAYAADYDADLGEVLDGNVSGVTVRVDGTGGWYGQCMSGAFVNNTSETIRVRVPVGMRLVPPDEGVQTMVTAGGEILEIPPGESSQPFIAFCSEMHDAPPSASGDFQNGGLVEDPRLMAVLERIQRAEATNDSAQAAVWSVTDELDVSANDSVAEFLPPEEVPPGRAAGAGLAAGVTGLGLAEVMRRISEIKTSRLTTSGGKPAPTKSDAGDFSELDDLDTKNEKTSPSGDDDGLDPDGDKLYQDPEKDTKTPEEQPEKKDDKKPKPPPKPPKPPVAGEGEQGIKWDRDRKRVVVNDGTTNFEAGRGGFWIGIGNAPGPNTNPFELKPPDTNFGEGGVTGRSRGDQVDVKIETGDDKRPVHIFRDGSTDTTRLQRGHFVLNQQGNRTSIQDLVNGRPTGASYDGSTGDFSLFRNNFRASRTGDTFSASDTTPGGRQMGASYNAKTGDFSAQSGDHSAVRSGSAYGYQWGDRSLVYDAGKKLGGYEFPTNGGKGSLSIGGGADGQFGVTRVQPLRIGGRDARLNIDYSRMLRDSGGGLETDFTAGIDVGRVSVNWSPGDKPKFAYNVKF